MDFFARLFSSSSQKRNDVTSEENSVQIRPRTESNLEENYHESGSYCRGSRVDQIEAPVGNIVVASSEKPLYCNEVIPNSVNVITRTLDCWNAETCVRLLRMPSVQNYSGLRKLISESDRVWMIEFLQMGGLEVLFESVDRLSSKKSNQARLEHTLLLLQCVSCLKAVTNSHNALEFIVQQRAYAKKIAEVLCSQNPLVKKQLFEFMSTLCVFSEEGHHLTLDVLESYRVTQKLRYRFAILMVEIKQAEVLPYVAAVLGLINCVILGACGFRFRTRLRNEFLALGLLDLLESLKQLPDEEVQLQCSVFGKSQMADEEHARSLGIRSSFSHFALFQALLDKVEDTPLSASFLVLLQNLNQLDPNDTKTDYVWSILEEITERALSGAGSVLRSWMLNECRRNSLKSIATQTTVKMTPKLAFEDAGVYKGQISAFDEEENGSLKSFDSRDSGIPVSRNQSFASSGPRSPRGTLKAQYSIDQDFAVSTEVTCPKGCETENVLKSETSPGFFKAIGLSFIFMRSSSKRSQNVPNLRTDARLSQYSMDNVPLSLRSESPIPQSDVLMEENSKTRKPFGFPFFNRSKKYSLLNNPPKVTIQPPSPDLRHNLKQALSAASSRDGMTSMDVKRSRKQNQYSNSLSHDDDSSSQASVERDTSISSESTSSTFEFHENQVGTERSPPFRSFSSSENCKNSELKEQLGHLSKSTSDLTQSVPPPPPPPPPPFSMLPEVQFRPKNQFSLDLPHAKGNRSSWSCGSTGKEFDDLDKKKVYNTLPRPKSKMKTLNWAKIPSSHVSVHSIWSEIDREPKPVELNFEEMEKLFCQDESSIKRSRTNSKQRVNSEVSLLDSKRSLSIAVFLKQFKGGLEEVVEYVRQCKHKEIGSEKLRTLLHLLPDANEVKLLCAYSGDMNVLGNAEKFILRLNAIDNYDSRVEGMLLLEEFPNTYQILHESVQKLLDACSELLINKGFKNFLRLVLVTGNFMNSGSYAGNAVGFRLSTLPKLLETRANKPRITLLHYLVEEAQRKDKESLKFTNDLLEKLNQCSRLTLENLAGEVNSLDKSLERLNSRIAQEGGQLRKFFAVFVQNGIKQVTVLKKKMEEIRNLSDQLAKRFCEDEKKFQLEECLNIVNIFCAKIKMAEAENQARKVADEKRCRASGNMKDSRFRNLRNCTL